MTDGNHSINEVPALLEERRRYEAWIAALDARRDSTPAHVFERVHSDYRNRLQQVAVRLSSFRHAMEDERASVQSRLSLLEAEEQMRRDERAELDLRAHVGELEGDDASAAFTTVDEAISHLAGEKGGLQRRVDELNALLSEPAVDAQAPAAADEIEKEVPPLEELTTPAPSPVAQAPLERPSTPGGSFDEMAFLDAVVGKDGKDGTGGKHGEERTEHVDMTSSEPPREPQREPFAAPVYERIIQRDEPDSESLLAGLGGPRGGGEDQPLAANVPANTPIVLRPSGSIEQSKTLKCNECGAMNYPTEWYCERCGAELAAL